MAARARRAHVHIESTLDMSNIFLCVDGLPQKPHALQCVPACETVRVTCEECVRGDGAECVEDRRLQNGTGSQGRPSSCPILVEGLPQATQLCREWGRRRPSEAWRGAAA